MILLQTKNLIKRYSGRTVVDQVSITVNQGEIVGLLGRNGAGKTTSFRMIIGMISPEGGSVVFDGVDVTRMPMYKRARRGMGYLSQEPSIFQRLTVRQNLLAILEIMTMSRGVRRMVTDARPTQEIQRMAIRAGMVELRKSALLKVAQGVTSMEEILRDVPPEFLGLED